MTVRFDEATQRWRVVGHDGTVFEEFDTNAQAWAWIDQHGDSSDEERRHRIGNAIRQW